MTSLSALIGFAIWTALLVLVAVSWRVVEVLRGKPANSWTRGGSTPRPAFVTRVEHANLNCVENLPMFATVVLVAAAMGKSTVTDSFAPFVLYTRIAQSVVHLVGTSHLLVLARATFFSVQLFLLLWMALSLLNWV
jgi:uncharacterized MAPEG superfamily protein